MIVLLEDYIALLRENESTPNKSSQSYHLPSDTVSPDEWAEFDHVYQIHCPKLFMDNAIRDVCLGFIPWYGYLRPHFPDYDAVLLFLPCTKGPRISYGYPVYQYLPFSYRY